MEDIDAFDKVTGRTKYTDDYIDTKRCICGKKFCILIAHGKVLSDCRG